MQRCPLPGDERSNWFCRKRWVTRPSSQVWRNQLELRALNALAEDFSAADACAEQGRNSHPARASNRHFSDSTTLTFPCLPNARWPSKLYFSRQGIFSRQGHLTATDSALDRVSPTISTSCFQLGGETPS